LQDAHNLAWRLSLWHKNGQSAPNLSLLQSRYETERRPVAQRNAALSVRNYRRILELTKACDLNDQHPTFLVRLLDQMTLLPLPARQSMFQSLLETAMMPLSALQNPSNPHAQLITRNVRKILKEGGGLPLLFPKFELGFGYGDKSDDEISEDWTKDSRGYTPQLKVGYLLPHVELEVTNYSKERHPKLRVIQRPDSTGAYVTSSDLPSQLRLDDPCFALLLVSGSDPVSEMVLDVLDMVRVASDVRFASIHVVEPNKQSAQTIASKFDLIVQDNHSKLSEILSADAPVVILIRPDGHVANIISIQDKQNSDLKNIIIEAIHQ